MTTAATQSTQVQAGMSAPTHRLGIVSVFRKAFRDSRKSTMWLAIGLSLYTLFIMSFYPSMVDQAEEMDKLIQGYPEAFISMFYSGPVDEFSVADPGNYVQVEFATWMMLIAGSILIVQAFNAITNAERDGTMDMLLSLPVSRRDYLIGRALSTALGMLVVLITVFAGFWAASLIWSEFDVTFGGLLAAILGAFFPLMVIAGFSYFLAAAVPSSRHFSGAVAYLFMIGSYLLYSFSGSVDQLRGIRPLILFDYYNAGEIIRDGVNIANVLLLSVVALVYFGLAWWLIDKKELGV